MKKAFEFLTQLEKNNTRECLLLPRARTSRPCLPTDPLVFYFITTTNFHHSDASK